MSKILLTAVGVFAIFIGIVLVRFNIKRRHIMRCAREASDQQLEAVYLLLERPGSAESNAAVLVRTNKVAPDDDATIPIPSYVPPWGGRALKIINKPASEVQFQFIHDSASEARLDGKQWRVLPVARSKTKTGKERNHFAPERYASKPELLAALAAICPKYPAELLGYLMTGAETFECDGIDQVRIGGSPAWVQDQEFPNCPECKKRMSLICQLPGTLLPGKKLPRGTFFFFGCPQHPDQTKTISQFS